MAPVRLRSSRAVLPAGELERITVVRRSGSAGRRAAGNQAFAQDASPLSAVWRSMTATIARRAHTDRTGTAPERDADAAFTHVEHADRERSHIHERPGDMAASTLPLSGSNRRIEARSAICAPDLTASAKVSPRRCQRNASTAARGRIGSSTVLRPRRKRAFPVPLALREDTKGAASWGGRRNAPAASCSSRPAKHACARIESLTHGREEIRRPVPARA